MAEGGYSTDKQLRDDDIPGGISDEFQESQYGTSDALTDPWCDPCHDDGLYVPVQEYCPTCVEFYCANCSKAHRRPALTRNHATLRGSDMPSCQAEKPLRYQQCNSHVGNFLDQFCCRHKELVCLKCTKENHASCETKSITDACEGLDKDDIDTFKNVLNEANNTVLSVKSIIEDNISDVETQRTTALKEAKTVYENVVLNLKAIYKTTNEHIEKEYTTQRESLLDQISTLNIVRSSVEQSLNNMEKYQTVDPRCFLNIQEIVRITREDTCKFNNLSKALRQRGMSFSTDQQLQQFVSSAATLGTVNEQSREYKSLKPVPEVIFPVAKSSEIRFLDIKLTRGDSLSVRLDDDNTGCFITGIDVTPDGRIVLADCHNKKIKMFSSEKKHQSSLSLKYYPGDIAVVNNEEAIVSLRDLVEDPWKYEYQRGMYSWLSKLYIIDIKANKPSLKQTINLNFPATAVTPYQDKIIATCLDQPRSVKLIDRSGRVYWSRSLDDQGHQLFSNPWYNTCFLENNRLRVVVSDISKRTITKLDGDTGDVIKVCTVPGKTPVGVSADGSGNIYVCCRDSNEIYAWRPHLESPRILLTKSDGLGDRPFCIKYNDKNRQLLVSYSFRSDRQNFIDCYNMS